MSMKEIMWCGGEAIDIALVKKLENLWKITFPEQYVNIVIMNDSGRPRVKDANGNWQLGIIDIPKWQTTDFRFLSFQNSEFSGEPMVMITYKAFEECLPIPDKLLPFANDGGGNIYFFDYRKNSSEPAIVFLDHEQAVTEEDLPEEDLKKKPLYEWLNSNLYHVCDSFFELLDMIRPANFN